MSDLKAQFFNALNAINGVLWHDYVLLFVLGVGVLFTLWSVFAQYRSLTHGVSVIRGKYDDKNDPGAINHFQALSTALSATVGLGNIAGVALAISLGGPGAVFWMWVTGFVGMALKFTEVTLAMLYRNTDNPEEPHGGPMWVAQKGFKRLGLGWLGTIVGGVFCVTLIISTFTGGNMFQAWNVADISFEYFGMPKIATGIILTIGVALVILGGIKRIGDVAGKIVPLMCGVYILAGLFVIIRGVDQIPAMFALIFREAFAPSEAAGAFIGGTMGYGFLKGMQRALFSNEAGQGSSPIAHSAAKTREPVREGVVAGLEPFVDTLCVCTITAMVILLSGVWNRAPGLSFAAVQHPTFTQSVDAEGDTIWTLEPVPVAVANENEAAAQMRAGKEVFLVVRAGVNGETGGAHHRIEGTLAGSDADGWTAVFRPFESAEAPTITQDGVYLGFKGATLTAKAFDRAMPGLGLWIVPATAWLFAYSTLISWSYYGEQGIVYLLKARAVMPYRIIYCLLILVSTSPLVRSEGELDVLSTLGTGFMLFANIPIMLIFGHEAMHAYKDYIRRLKRGEMRGHAFPKITDVVEGKDVE